MNRREFLATSLAAGTTGSATSMAAVSGDRKAVKIIGVSCSPRKGKTTAAALNICLEAAKAVLGVTTELIELAGRNISGFTIRPIPRPAKAALRTSSRFSRTRMSVASSSARPSTWAT